MAKHKEAGDEREKAPVENDGKAGAKTGGKTEVNA